MLVTQSNIITNLLTSPNLSIHTRILRQQCLLGIFFRTQSAKQLSPRATEKFRPCH